MILTGKISSIETTIDSIELSVADHTGKISSIETTIDSIELSVADVETGMATIDVKVNSITSTVYNMIWCTFLKYRKMAQIF